MQDHTFTLMVCWEVLAVLFALAFFIAVGIIVRLRQQRRQVIRDIQNFSKELEVIVNGKPTGLSEADLS